MTQKIPVPQLSESGMHIGASVILSGNHYTGDSYMADPDIRWKQRFQNFEKALHFLTDAAQKSGLSALERAGMIHTYEFTFELAWKTANDFLEDKKVRVQFPRDVIKEAYKYELIADGDIWMDMLDKRNLMSHTYDEETAELAVKLITGGYIAAIRGLYQRLAAEP